MQVWGAKDVFYDNLNACKQVGNVILGFHEPDLSSGASMSVQVSSPASHDMVDRHHTDAPAGPQCISGCLASSMSSARPCGTRISSYSHKRFNPAHEWHPSGLPCMLRSETP